MDRSCWKSEQMECRGDGLAQTISLVLLAVVASMAPVASMATMVPEAVTALLAPKLTFGILQPRLQLAATPRETDGFRSLRRVDKIGGMQADGLFFKIGEERAKLLAKLLLECDSCVGFAGFDGFDGVDGDGFNGFDGWGDSSEIQS